MSGDRKRFRAIPARVRERWDRSAKIRALLAYLPRADLGKTVKLAVLVLLNGLTPVVFIVASGLLVGSVPAAVQAGSGSPEADRLVVLLAVTGVVFALRQVVTPLRHQAVWELAWAVDIGLQQRAMRATTKPVGIAHLEDTKSLDKIAVARGLDNWLGPGQAIAGVANLATRYLSATGSTAVVIAWKWWLGIALALMYIVNSSKARTEFGHIANVVYGFAGTFRRVDYMREMALTPEAAKETRVFGMSQWLGERYRDHWLTAMREVWRRRQRSLRIFMTMFGLSLVGKTAAFFYVGLAGVRGDIDLATAVVLFQAMNGMSAFGQISDDDVKVAQGSQPVPAALALENDVAAISAVTDRGTLPATDLPRSSIRFENVSFRYPGSDIDVFSGLDLEMPAGSSLALVGVNGAGKTTAVKLLARMYDPTEGRITVDGIDVRDLDSRSWQRRVASIFQDFIRYELPARDNVGFGAPELKEDDEVLLRAAARAGALDVVLSLPHGWDTVLSRQFTNGVELSGGQWQRIALARAMAAVEAGATVLVLDEPTANLDVRAEAELYDRFLDITANLTSIVISHRFSTVRRADRIVVIDDGRVVEDGSHEQLLEQGGRYARMYTLQAARFSDADGVDLAEPDLERSES